MEELFNKYAMSIDTYIMVKLKEKTAKLKDSLTKKNRAPIALSMGAPTANPPEALIEKLEGEIPQAMYENKITDMVREFEMHLRSQGLDLETYMQYMGLTEESLREQYEETAEKRVKLRLALEKIAEIENIEASEDDLSEEYKKIADVYNMDSEAVKLAIPAEDLKKDVAVSKAMDLVKETAVVK